ncbi:MAG: hypothetical protein M3O46_20505 [Myxococcota bacterium]|nr:hypothetical protein [Myxococcota bacterium]
MKRDALVAGAISVSWGFVVAVGAYAVMRTIQFFLNPDPNPSAVIWSAHAGYFWRAWTVSYAGGIAAFVVLLVARNHPVGSARALLPAMSIAAALLALQGALFP